MSKSAKATAALASAGLLIIGWNIGNQVIGGGEAEPKPEASTTPQAPEPGTSPAGSDSAKTGLKDGNYTGVTSPHRFGDVTVTITVKEGNLAQVQAAANARDDHSADLNNRALPRLREQVLAAQNAQVDWVSGATYTSQAYLTSLQSALDQAK